MEYKDVLKNSLMRTSLKGVPRIITSERKCLKSLWSISVFSLLIVCFYLVARNLQEFLRYESYMLITKHYFDFHKPEHRSLIPGILLCDKNPFSSNESKFREHGAPLPREYFELVKTLSTKSGLNKCSPAEFEYFLASPRGYYQYVGKKTAKAVGHEYLNLGCSVIMDMFTDMYTEPCQNGVNVKVTELVLPEYFNCRLYEPNQMAMEKPAVIGFEFLIHIDDGFTHPLYKYSSCLFPKPSAGAVISFVSKGQAAAIDESSIDIAPGFETTLQFSISSVHHLKTLGSCVDKRDLSWQGASDYCYTRGLCRSECVRDKIAKKCHCNDISVLHYPELSTRVRLSNYCGDLKNMTALKDRMNCALNRLKEVYQQCRSDCKVLCKHINYCSKISLSRWPGPSEVGKFYSNHIKSTPLEQKYSQFEDILNAIASGKAEEYSYEKKYTAMRFIEDNVAKLTVFPDNWEITEYDEKLRITPAAFLAQLGGTLNLWAGITVMVLPEFLEMVYRLILCMLGTKDRVAVNGTGFDNMTENDRKLEENEYLVKK